MLDITEQLRRYGDAVAETVERVPAADVTVMTTEPRRPRRPVWQPLAAAAAAVILLAGGVWFATRSSDSSPSDQGAATGRDQIEIGVATMVIPDGMTLEQLAYVDPPVGTSPVTRSDGSVSTDTIVRSVRARLSTAVGTCTITSSRGQVGIERFDAELEHLSHVWQSLEARVGALNQQLASLPPGAGDATSIASQRDAALKQIDSLGQQLSALTHNGPAFVPAGEGFAPTDAGRTTWLAQATPGDVVQVTCPDRATAHQLVDATTLPTPAP